jgi:uncharacterized protein (DUF305 family)
VIRRLIDHHEGAVARAKLALPHPARPEIKALAQEILSAQKREIDVMQQHATGDPLHGMERA